MGFLDIFKKKKELGDIPKPPVAQPPVQQAPPLQQPPSQQSLPIQQPAQQPFNLRKYDELGSSPTYGAPAQAMPPLPSFDVHDAAQEDTQADISMSDYLPYREDPIEEPKPEDFKPFPPPDTKPPPLNVQQPSLSPPVAVPSQPRTQAQMQPPQQMQRTQIPDFLPPDPLMNTMKTRQFELFVSAMDYDFIVTSLKDMTKNLKRANDEIGSYDEQDAKFRKQMNAFHDALDFMQKKLMYIDGVLFE
ncbi:MAG: hypothetical protein V1725_01535 [archaeon]